MKPLSAIEVSAHVPSPPDNSHFPGPPIARLWHRRQFRRIESLRRPAARAAPSERLFTRHPRQVDDARRFVLRDVRGREAHRRARGPALQCVAGRRRPLGRNWRKLTASPLWPLDHLFLVLLPAHRWYFLPTPISSQLRLPVVPGPVEFDPAVLGAAAHTAVSHMDPRFREAFGEALELFRAISGGDEVGTSII